MLAVEISRLLHEPVFVKQLLITRLFIGSKNIYSNGLIVLNMLPEVMLMRFSN